MKLEEEDDEEEAEEEEEKELKLPPLKPGRQGVSKPNLLPNLPHGSSTTTSVHGSIISVTHGSMTSVTQGSTTLSTHGSLTTVGPVRQGSNMSRKHGLSRLQRSKNPSKHPTLSTHGSTTVSHGVINGSMHGSIAL